MARKKEMTKDEMISAEVKRLTEIFRHVPQEKLTLCANLIQNASYLAVNLRELQKDMDETGLIEDYNNGGGQAGRKISASVQIYTKWISNYNAVIKTLASMLPSGEKATAIHSADPMADFLSSK